MLSLAAAIAAFTGSPVALDVHLSPPPCSAAPAIAWSGRSAVNVSCAAPNWRLLVPVVAPPSQPLIRRGDIVSVAAGGPGFRVAVDAVAESDAAAGARVRLRNRVTGERIVAAVSDTGEIMLPGFNSGDGGR